MVVLTYFRRLGIYNESMIVDQRRKFQSIMMCIITIHVGKHIRKNNHNMPLWYLLISISYNLSNTHSLHKFTINNSFKDWTNRLSPCFTIFQAMCIKSMLGIRMWVDTKYQTNRSIWSTYRQEFTFFGTYNRMNSQIIWTIRWGLLKGLKIPFRIYSSSWVTLQLVMNPLDESIKSRSWLKLMFHTLPHWFDKS